MRNHNYLSRLLAVMLCVTALFCSLTCSARASDSDYSAALASLGKGEKDTKSDSTAKQDKKDTTGKPLSEKTEMYTRDLLYDEDTHKQFITVSTREGDTFYIIIDYDKPADEGGEQYEAYFLNAVDNADLAALLGEQEEEAPPVCTCSTRCAAGAVNMTCEVCAANMTECAGEEPEPEPEEPEEETESHSGYGAAAVALILLLAMAGGGTAYYIRMKKPKTDTRGPTDLDNYEFSDEDEDGEEYESLPEGAGEPDEEPEEDYPMEDSDEA